MAAGERYLRQVGLLVRILPQVAEERCFALKGGTAINLFVRDLPRLSVDIDLAYLPIEERGTSLRGIEAALERIGARIERAIPSCRVRAVALRTEGIVNRLFVRERGVQVKIEVTPVLRGCVYEPETRSVSAGVEERFGFAAMQVVSFADLYAGKLVAALDRQHPRDLFDARGLLANEGIDERLRTAFVVYVISHGRPIAELLAPTRRELADEFTRGLAGMVETPVVLEDLVRTREEVVAEAVGGMPEAHRDFLVSFETGEPDWSLLGVREARRLPAVRWRMRNVAGLDAARRTEQAERLQQAFLMADDGGGEGAAHRDESNRAS